MEREPHGGQERRSSHGHWSSQTVQQMADVDQPAKGFKGH